MLVLLALAASAFFLLKMRRYLPERARGAELAPAETIFFVQFPNLRQTAARIPKSNLYQIWQEPDVQAFLEKPRHKAPWMRAWSERMDEMLRVAPGELFVAFTSIDGPHPKFVGGFSFAGSQREAGVLAAHLREQLFPAGELVSSFRSNWYFCASDSGLLDAMLARFGGTADPTLAAAPVFQQSIAPLGVGQDLVIFGEPAQLAGRLDLLADLGGQGAGNERQAVAMATKIDGARLHDLLFLRGSGSAQAGALSRQTLSVASSQTLLYYTADLAVLAPGPAPGALTNLVPGFAEMEKRLAEKDLSWKDLATAIGPELGVVAEWPEDAALPTVLLASELRDTEKAQAFVDALTTASAPGAAWSKEEHDGITLWNSSAQGAAFLRPSVTLTDRFALLGMSPEAVTRALSTAKSATDSLGQTVAFQDVARFAPEQALAFGYLDFQRLFERVYRMARPFITLSLAFSAEAGAQFDAGKLPPVEAISKHLSATVLAQSRVEGGTLIESVGSLTFPELLLGLGAAGTAAEIPDFSGLLPKGAKRGAPATPPGTSASPLNSRTDDANSAPASSAPEKTEPNHK